MSASLVALVPMRAQSERVPGKNYRLFAGAPLFHHIVRSLLACPAVTTVAVDTDGGQIADEVARSFPQVHVIERPLDLRGPKVSMNEILLHDVTVIKADHYLQTHSTNPLLSTATISRAVEAFRAWPDQFDSLFSVTRRQTRFWDANGRPLNHDLNVLLRTQDLPPVFEENSCLYLFTADGLRARRNRIGKRPQLFEIDPDEAWDIDEEMDFAMAEFLYQRRQEAHRP